MAAAGASNKPGLQSIASGRHTLGLLLIVLTLAVSSRILVTQQPGAALEEFGRTRIYLIALASEWFFFAYLLVGLRREVVSVRRIIDVSSWNLGRWGIYTAVAVGAAVVWMACGFVLSKLVRPAPEDIKHLMVLLPKNGMEKALWIVLSLSAAFCEEFLYRGYLLQRFRQLTGSVLAGVVIQAVVYGVAHAALPRPIVIGVTCLGLVLGGVATLQRSLIPGMLLHAAFDVLAGVVTRR
jgi:membrane protease YdiL (CAAX protease family)